MCIRDSPHCRRATTAARQHRLLRCAGASLPRRPGARNAVGGACRRRRPHRTRRLSLRRRHPAYRRLARRPRLLSHCRSCRATAHDACLAGRQLLRGCLKSNPKTQSMLSSTKQHLEAVSAILLFAPFCVPCGFVAGLFTQLLSSAAHIPPKWASSAQQIGSITA